MSNGHNIELNEKHRERLTELATEQGVSPSEVLDQLLLPTGNGHSANGDTQDSPLDVEYHAYARQNRDLSVDRSQVREALSGISGSLADTVISERDER